MVRIQSFSFNPFLLYSTLFQSSRCFKNNITNKLIKNNNKISQIHFNESSHLLSYAKLWNKLLSDSSNQKLLKNLLALSHYKISKFRNNRSALVNSLVQLSSLYLWLNFKSLFSFYLYLRNLSQDDTLRNVYKLYFTFTSNRLFINLLSFSGKNYTSLAVGLFLKFFKNKKSFKKNKLIKILLVKYLRKLLIVAGVKNLYFYVHKKPLFFQELCKTLTTPLVNSFINPLTSVSVNESSFSRTQPFSIRYLFFKHSKPYNIMRLPRKGRLKRKIMRRIIRTNKISD